MRRSVSGDTPTVKVVGVKAVMVRQVPLMEMESPRWASSRRKVGVVIVRVVPVSGEGSRAEMAVLGVVSFEGCL